jgi:hypothetical protein
LGESGLQDLLRLFGLRAAGKAGEGRKGKAAPRTGEAAADEEA